MSYADRAREHRRSWNERAETMEQFATSHGGPEPHPMMLKAAAQMRRHARWPYWLVWSVDLLGSWWVSLVMAAGLWVWWLADDEIRGGWPFWVFAVAWTLLMIGFSIWAFVKSRRLAEQRRHLEERMNQS